MASAPSAAAAGDGHLERGGLAGGPVRVVAHRDSVASEESCKGGISPQRRFIERPGDDQHGAEAGVECPGQCLFEDGRDRLL